MEEMQKSKEMEEPKGLEPIRFEEPIQCHLWQKEELIPDDFTFSVVTELIEDSHFEREIVRCAQCGQHYFYEWYEEIDWEEGNDHQYTTYIPIPQDEDMGVAALNRRNPFELLMVTPRLQHDTGGGIKWIGK